MPATSKHNLNAPLVNPFRGKPCTRLRIDSAGNPSFIVAATGLHPITLRIARIGAWIGSAAMLAVHGHGLAVTAQPEWLDGIKALMYSAATWPSVRYLLGYLLRSKKRVALTRDRISFRRGLLAKNFETRHLHSFRLLPHDKAKDEADRHAFLDRKYPPKWWRFKRTKYYGKSFHVSLEYLGERHDIITVHGERQATAIHARLKACDAILCGQGLGDRGTALSPDSEWGTPTGSL